MYTYTEKQVVNKNRKSIVIHLQYKMCVLGRSNFIRPIQHTSFMETKCDISKLKLFFYLIF
jgi:hypothetical protein